jgi:NCAIR mutase (PurE)-related protein
MLDKTGRAIVSRLDESQISALQVFFHEAHDLRSFSHAKLMVIKNRNFQLAKTGGRVGVLTAGTADLAVAEEVTAMVEEMGCSTIVEADSGVAGIHRVVEPLRSMIRNDVDCLIVIAGREGALPTVVAGLVDIPIIAVPTSQGYGYGGKGRAALMAMLQACSLGLAVVNIDAGIAAGVVAAQISNRIARARNLRRA